MPADKYHPRQFTSASAPSPYDRHPSANPRLGSREAREVAVVARRETSQIQQREPVGSYEYQRAKRDLEVAEEMARGPPKRSKRKPRYHKRATEAKAALAAAQQGQDESLPAVAHEGKDGVVAGESTVPTGTVGARPADEQPSSTKIEGRAALLASPFAKEEDPK